MMRRNTRRPFLWAKEQSIHLEKTSQKGASWQIRTHLIALKLISRPLHGSKLAWQSSKRSELAEVFQVVPSQINYVIKTRFTESRDYIVESKRGGGAISRIGKVQFSDHHQMPKTWQPILERPSASRSSMIASDARMKKNY